MRPRTLEFKRSTAQLKSAGQTLCAFLNGNSGTVLIGVNDKGNIIGQEVNDHTQQELGSVLARLAPETSVEASYLDIGKNNKRIIILKANFNANLQPYTFDGKPYIRLESNTMAMPRDQYHRLSINNIQRNKGWEDGIANKVTIDDLDTEEIINTINVGLANGRITKGNPAEGTKKILKRLNLLEDGKITNAAVVLFAKNPVTWFPQCKIRLARFRGTNKREFIDNRQVEGNAFKIIDETMAFAIRYLHL